MGGEAGNVAYDPAGNPGTGQMLADVQTLDQRAVINPATPAQQAPGGVGTADDYGSRERPGCRGRRGGQAVCAPATAYPLASKPYGYERAVCRPRMIWLPVTVVYGADSGLATTLHR